MFIPAEKTDSVIYEFGPFQLNPRETLLVNKDGGVVQLTPKVFDTLLALVEQAGHVVGKDDLMQQLWPDTLVEEGSLTQNISLLRRALAEGNGGKKYIDTVPKRGYRFVVPVRVVSPVETRNLQNAFESHGQSSGVQALVEENGPVADPIESRAAVDATKPRRISHARFIYLLAGACVLVAAALYAYSSYRRNSRGEIVTVKSIAVLPFKTIGSQNREDLLGLGMADSLIIRLSQLERTKITPTGSVTKYTNQDQNPILIGKELGVEAVLDGTVQRDGDRIRVTAQLIRSSDGKALWSGKFDEKYQNIFHLQDLVSEQVADSLVPEVSRERRSVGALTENVEAYQDYLTGLYFWNIRTKANLPKAISYLEQAVQKDPKFARAYAVLADSYFLGSQPEYEILAADESLRRAEQAAQRALELNENIPEAHVVKARVLDARSNINDAEREFRRALEIDNNLATTHLRYGCFLLYSRVNLSAALVQIDRARQLDPVSPLINYKYAFLMYLSRDYDLAIAYYKRALELQPDVPNGHIHLSAAYVQKGMFAEALDELQKATQDNPRRVLGSKAMLFGFWGRRSDALKVLAELQRLEGNSEPLRVAAVYGALGDKQSASEWLRKVHVDQSTSALLQFDPQMDPLRKDPAFPEIRLTSTAD